MCKACSIIAAGIVLSLALPAAAMDPSRALSQLHHTAWTLEQGAPPDVWALAQTPDGYLWLGTGAGLYRFDGVVFEKLRPATGDGPPSSNVNALFVDRSGDLWVGFGAGQISRLHDHRLETVFAGFQGGAVNEITQDTEGTIWAALRSDDRLGGLARYAKGRWRMVGAAWNYPGRPASSVLAARDGAVWVVTAGDVLVLRRGSTRFEATGEAVIPGARLAQGPDGRIWVTDKVTGMHRLGASPRALRSRPPRDQPAVTPGRDVARMLFDRDGNLWGTFRVGGVFRLAAARALAADGPGRPAAADRVSMHERLTSDIAVPILEDREGDIWVGTNMGLDRFRSDNAVSAPGVPATSLGGFHAARGADGAVWISSGDTLYRAWAQRNAEAVAKLREQPLLAADSEGALWMVQVDELVRLRNGHRDTVSLPPWARGAVSSLMRDPSGALWIGVTGQGVFKAANGVWRAVTVTGAPAGVAPRQMLVDASGRKWFDFGRTLAVVDSDRTRLFSPDDRPPIGDIEIIYAGAREVLFGGDFGIARFDGQRFQTLRSEALPALSRVSGIVQTSRGETWLNGITGVSRISTADLDRAFQHPGRAPRFEGFDLRDGLPGVAQQDGHAPTAIEATDGRIWFVTSHGVAWIDPANLAHNPTPPPVSIRRLVADGAEYPFPTRLRLRPGASSLEIDYTALSLSVPDRVRFRYRLEGADSHWLDPGARRQAFYTRLGPGAYRFDVIAANNDGIWNSTGANLDITIPPTFIQSRWFFALCLVVAAMLLWLVYNLRVRRISARIQGRLEERLAERERIARELHDTLLQGFQGLMLRFQAVADSIPPTQAARRLIEEALDRADAVLVEGRDRVLALRAAQRSRDLAQVFVEAAAKLSMEPRVKFRLIVEGQPRHLHPLVRDEVGSVGEEALFNALQHGKPTSIVVSLTYHPRELRVHIRDDGVGMDTGAVIDGRRGHFGLIGMRERAERIHGEFSVSSRLGAGVEIELTVPGRVAYVSDDRPRSRARRPSIREIRDA